MGGAATPCSHLALLEAPQKSLDMSRVGSTSPHPLRLIHVLMFSWTFDAIMPQRIGSVERETSQSYSEGMPVRSEREQA
eukprot:366524-Chlamydomonas_euryale.AAC.10